MYWYGLTVSTSAFVLCKQAVVHCTPGRAGMVVVCLAILSLIIQVIRYAVSYPVILAFSSYNAAVFLILPLAILVINMIVLYAVRRASHSAAATLGRHQHQQSTSSNSTVPTIMLVTTSVIYVFLCSTWSFIHIISEIWLPQSRHFDIWNIAYTISIIMQRLIFIYNFFVYVITGKQFRSELRRIFCCCASTAASAANDDDDATRIPTHGQHITSTV